MANVPHPEQLQLPQTAPEVIRPVIDEYRRLNRERGEVARQLQEAETQKRYAETADVEAHAEALKAGENDPGTPNAERANTQIERLQRERDAYAKAVQDAVDEVYRAVREHRDDWHSQLADEREQIASDYLAALDTVDRLASDLNRIDSTEGMLRRFTENGKLRYKTPRFQGRDVSLVNELRKGAESPFSGGNE